MKFRHKKIKREHSIIEDALYWLEDLSKNPWVTDIIPGVIDVTNSRERGVVYKYETATGCKLLLKSKGCIQEAFVVTKTPLAVQEWATRIREEISMIESSLDKPVISKEEQIKKPSSPVKRKAKKVSNTAAKDSEQLLDSSESNLNLLSGIKQDYHLVEINQGLRDSYVESLASMGDLDDPTIEDSLQPPTREALKNLKRRFERKS